MDPAIARLTLNARGPLSPHALSFWQAVDVELPFAIFQNGSTTVLESDFSSLVSIRCEVYKGRSGGGDLLIEATPIPAGSLNSSLALADWNAGSNQHGTFTLSDEQMSQYVPAGVLECWIVIYAITSTGGRTNLGAGSFQIYRNRGVGSSLPPSLYYTKVEIDALLADISGGGGGGTTNLSVSRTSTTLTVASDTGSDASLPAATSSLAGIMTAADKVTLDAAVTPAELTAGLNTRAPADHPHTFVDIRDLPTTSPRDMSLLSLPLGAGVDGITHAITFAQAYYLMRVCPSAQNYVMALLLAGVTPKADQLVAIDSFFSWADATGFITGQKSGARLLLPVWNNMAANLINLLAASNPATSARAVNSAGFTMAAGYIRTNTGAGSPGFIAFDTTSSLAWDAQDWSMAYYSHLAAQTDDNAMIGGRDDVIAPGGYRYINTTTSTIARWSPGYTSGAIDHTMTTSNPLGLMYIGVKGTKLDARQVKAAGSTTLLDTTGSYDAVLQSTPFLGLAYNGELGPTSLSGQPASLFYIGRKIANDATESTDFAQALHDLATQCGATAV